MGNNNFKNLIKIFAISIIAVVGLFAFSHGAETAFSYDSGNKNQICE